MSLSPYYPSSSSFTLFVFVLSSALADFENPVLRVEYGTLFRFSSDAIPVSTFQHFYSNPTISPSHLLSLPELSPFSITRDYAISLLHTPTFANFFNLHSLQRALALLHFLRLRLNELRLCTADPAEKKKKDRGNDGAFCIRYRG